MPVDKQYWTAKKIIDRVKDELDLTEETFIDDPEFVRYCNAAIDRAEQQVIGMHVDYFLTSALLTFVTGTERYPLPANIYAHKIRRIIYNFGGRVYVVNRLRDWKKFEHRAQQNVNQSSNLYEYLLVNDTPGSPELVFVPPAKEDGPVIEVWYCRQANRFDDTVDANGNLVTPLDDPSNILDIPEAFNYIVEFVKMKCDIKEKRLQGQVPTGDYPEVQMEYREFIGSIAEMVPDADNAIEADYSMYEEHS